MFRLIDDASTVLRPNRSSAPVRTAHRVDPRLAALEVPIVLLRKAETLRREYEVDLQGVMRQSVFPPRSSDSSWSFGRSYRVADKGSLDDVRYMLSELEVVTGIVAGMAVPKERRAKMMKDNGLKVCVLPSFPFAIYSSLAQG
jgi:hypothetical protein